MYLHGTINPVSDPCGIVLITHGYAEHEGRYDQLVAELNHHQLTVFRYDHPGHGLSEGKRARVDVGDLLRQHYRVRKQIREMAPRLPLFLLGHSMGGLLTAASALTRPDDIAGVVLSGPALGINLNLPTPVIETMRRIGEITPGLPIQKLDPDALSYSTQNIHDYLEDPLNYTGPVQLLTAATMADLGVRVREHFPEWTPDVLVLQGADDTLVDVKVVRKFAETAGEAHEVRPIVDYIEIPGAKHELYQEDTGPIFATLTAQWIRDRI